MYNWSQQKYNWSQHDMTGKQVASLMRKNKVTIKELAKRMGITMKRIRQIRNTGDDVALRTHAACDWIEHITGELPKAAHAAYMARMA